MGTNNSPLEASTSAPERAKVVVVVPTFQERENIADIVMAVLTEQGRAGKYDLHVLVADSHSTDGTLQIVADLAAANPCVHLLDVLERGIGVGLFKGLNHAIDALKADVLFEMDADFQHNPADIPRFLEKITEGYDLVVGSRFTPGSVNRMPWFRRVLSVGANQILRMMLGLRSVTEITTSYRAFTRDLFLKVSPDSVPWQGRSFIFVPVLLVRMIDAGAHVTEIPMTMHPRMRGYSKMVYWEYIRDVMWFALTSRFKLWTRAGSRADK